jgi:uncharacterized protein (DUF427 family)
MQLLSSVHEAAQQRIQYIQFRSPRVHLLRITASLTHCKDLYTAEYRHIEVQYNATKGANMAISVEQPYTYDISVSQEKGAPKTM